MDDPEASRWNPRRRTPLFSEDRQAWVRAGELREGERLRTLQGAAEIVSIARKPGVHRVYNLEVQTEHTYFVSKIGVLVHNVSGCAQPSIVEHPSQGAARRAAFRDADIPTSNPPAPTTEPLRPGSRSPTGPPGEREVWTNPTDPSRTVHHDPFGHQFPDGEPIGPHYKADPSGPHHCYPSEHNPTTNH